MLFLCPRLPIPRSLPLHSRTRCRGSEGGGILVLHDPFHNPVTANPPAGGKLPAMKPQDICPGYFERDVQEIIERKGVKFCKYFCALCGSPVEPMKKDGGWVPRTHAPLEAPNENPRSGM
jgi:hypothetical protein